MNVHSLTILHYGKDYLSYALRSVYHSVDRLHIFYTANPSHGHTTNLPPIETKEELMAAAFAYDPDNKIIWHDMLNVLNEGTQRDLALMTVANAGAELVLVVDYDEVWPDNASEILGLNFPPVRNHLVNMIHFWRSFNWACYDNGWPVRLIDLRYNEGTHYMPQELMRVLHFGYATTNAVMHYKWEIHGHKNELRPNWFSTHWSAWPPIENCHPTNGRNEEGKPFWKPEPFGKETLPDFMRSHPFWGLERIE